MDMGFRPYEKKILGETVKLDKALGYKCRGCGNIEFDEQFEKNIKAEIEGKIHQKAINASLKAKKSNDLVPIYVSKIKEVRNAKDISQRKLGEALNISEQRFGAIEKNNNIPNIFKALIIADILKVKVEDIYELVYIPENLYRKLLTMNTDLEVIDELEDLYNELDQVENNINENGIKYTNRRTETRKELQETYKDKIESGEYTITDIRQLANEILLKDTSAIEIKEIIESNKARKKEIQEEIENTFNPQERKEEQRQMGLKVKAKDELIKLRCAILYEDWVKVKEKFADELKIASIKEVAPDKK